MVQTVKEPKISKLSAEILNLVKSTETFQTKGFEIFNLDDLDSLISSNVQMPIAGVAYEGGTPQVPDTGNGRTSTGSTRVNKFNVNFSVIIALNYNIMGQSDIDTKVTAMDLLHEVRQVVLGFSGVNNMPWRLISENPIDGSSDRENTGIIYYGQLWSTDINVSGNFTAN